MIFEFNQFALDTTQFKLCQSGNPVSIEPQAFDLLVYLIENRDRVVSRDELLENLWKGKVVTDSALGVALKVARKAIGDSGNKQAVIKTIHGRGYQFVAEISKSTEALSAKEVEIEDSSENLPFPDKPSIVVLPFVNMSDDSEQEYLVNGITEDIITELSRFHSLFVIARNSSFVFKGQSVDVGEIGRKLRVQYVVEGSVRKVSNRVRVTAQLIDAASGNHIWAERYDRELKDIFAVQDDLVKTIVSTMDGRIDVAGKTRVTRMSDAHLRAYDFCLRAAAAEDGNTKEDYQRARQYLEQAIELDPGLAMAHYHLSLVSLMESMAHWVDGRDKALGEAMKAAESALALDDTDSRIFSQLGILLLYRRKFDEAGQKFEKAIRLNPNDFQAIALQGLYLTAIGKPAQAIQKFDQAMHLNPMEPSWIRWLRGIACFTAEEFEEAINNLASINKPMNEVRGWLAASYAQAGCLDDARANLEKFLRIAKQEMAVFPGREIEAWEPYWHGAIEYRDKADFDRLYDGLRKAGME